MGVELHYDGGAIADLVISGPIDMAWATAFRDHARGLAEQRELRVVVLRAEGRFFCPGGDLAWMSAQPDREPAVRELATTFHEGLLALAELDAPVVARVHATAAGGGMSIVLQADVAVAAASATFAIAYTGVGLSPDGGASWLLPRIVGQRAASDILLLNRTLDAHEAAALGIVTATVPDDGLDGAVDAYVQRLASGPTASYGAVKRLLASSSRNDLATQLELEAAAIGAAAGSPTGREGIDAFVAKRRPAFPAGNS